MAPTVIKDKLLLSIYSQLCVVHFGEIGRRSLAWVQVVQLSISPNTLHTLCLVQVGRVKVMIFGAEVKVIDILTSVYSALVELPDAVVL